MVTLSELEKHSSKTLRLHANRVGERQVVVPRRVGSAVFALILVLIMCAVDVVVIVSALGPGGSGITGEHVLWVAGFSIFCLALLVTMLIAVFGRHAVFWDESGIRVQSRCLFVRIMRSKAAWKDIQDIGLFTVYRRSGSVLSLPYGSVWGENEGEALMGLLRECWTLRRPKDAETGIEVVAISQVPEESRGLAVAVLMCIVIFGIMITFVFGAIGLWKYWGSLLGLIPRIHAPNLGFLVVPPLFAFVLVVVPLFLIWMLLRPNVKQNPQAFFFDNRIGKMAISATTRTAPESPAEIAALPGYDYSEIDSFGYHSYIKSSSASNSARRTVFNYVLDARMKNGSIWRLDEPAYESEAQTRVTELTRSVKLREASCPSELRRRPGIPAAVMERRLGDIDYFVWRDKSSFGTSGAFLLMSAVFVALGSFFKGKGFEPGFIFFGAFALVMFSLSMYLLVSGVRKMRNAFALRLAAAELQSGTLPMSRLQNGSSAEEIEAAFVRDKIWPLDSVSAIATVFTEETWRQKVHYLEIIGEKSERPVDVQPLKKRNFLSIAGLDLGEAVDFEQVLEGRLREMRDGNKGGIS